MFLFKRRPESNYGPIDLSRPVDKEAAKAAADAVNRGDVDEANRICEATGNPRATAFVALQWVN